ncbi:MAG: SIMPL domain-containing protein [Patescibacteria group bacterium]
MEEQSVREIISATHRVRTLGAFALGMLGLFLLVATLGELKGLRFIGSGVPAINTINVTGEGEVFAVPDTATFSATVQETAKDVKTAQDAAAKKNNAVIAYLKGAGIDEKDIQTTDYSIYPQYDYQQITCVAYPCPPGKQTLSGYQVSETLTVKVRDAKKAGDLLSGVGSRGATNVSGLSFTIDDQKALEAQARGKAIDDASGKAEALAEQLGVRLVRIVGFSEDGGGRPIYYAKTVALGMGGDAAAAPSPEIATGQNKIVSNVSITYEIQ